MKKYIFSVKTALAVFAVALSACSSDNDIVDNNPTNQEKPVSNKTMTFHASMDGGNDTRTYFRGNSTAWAANDNIYILNNASVPEETDRLTGAVFEISSGIGSKEADFEGGPIKANGNNQDDFYAFYPSSSYNTTSGKMTGNIPTVQYATDTTYNQALHFMTAHSTNSTFEFKNVCALLKIELTNNTSICRVKVVANPTLSAMNAQEFTYTSIAGDFEATVNTDGIATPTPTEDKKTYVELRASSDDGTATTPLGNGTFYMVVLPAAIDNGFTLLLEKTDGTIYQRINTKVKSFDRNQMYNLGTYNCSSTPSGMAALTDVVDLDLPSGTIWCKKNVKKTGSGSSTKVDGFVSSETDYGAFFSWGKTHVTSALGLTYTLPTLDDNNTTLKGSAEVIYSYKPLYCMPIYAQLREFYYHFSDGNKEAIITSHTAGWPISFTIIDDAWAKFTAPTGTGRYIILPYAGYYYSGIHTSEHEQARYWSRTYTGRTWEGTPEYYAYCLDLKITNNVPEVDLHSGLLGAGSWNDKGETGRSIRPVVTNEQIAPIY